MSDVINESVMKAFGQQLIRKVGGCDAAAAIFAAAGMADAKGTISKIQSGNLRLSVFGAQILEDAAGEFPITRLLAERLSSQAVAGGDLSELTAQSSETVGVVHGQIMRAMSDHSEGGREITRAEAGVIIANLRRQIDLSTRIIAELQGLK